MAHEDVKVNPSSYTRGGGATAGFRGGKGKPGYPIPTCFNDDDDVLDIENEALDANKLFSKDADSQVKTTSGNKPLDTNSGVDEKRGRSIIEKYKDKISVRGINIQKNPIFLGEGSRGSAFDIGNGKALKITDDLGEAKAANKIMEKKLKHVVTFFDVFQFGHTGIFGIVQEKLSKIPKEEARELDRAFGNLRFRYFISGKKSWDDVKKAIATDLSTRSKDIAKPKLSGWKENMIRHWQLLTKKYNIKEIVEELLSAGIDFHDYHSGNMMLKPDGSPVLIDIGYSKVSGGKEPDVIERIIREIEELKKKRLSEVKADKVCVIIGNFQPFNKGHSDLIRKLATKYTKVIIISKDENTFSYELTRDIIKRSLPDVEAKLESYKMHDDIPNTLSHISLEHDSSLEADVTFELFVDAASYDNTKNQIENSNSDSIDFKKDLIIIEKLKGLDVDGANGIDNKKLREKIKADDKKETIKMMDAHLMSDENVFNNVYDRMKEEIGAKSKNEINEDISDFGGEKAMEDVIKANAFKLKKSKGIDVTSMKRLGGGEQGIAYDIGGGKVMKVTTVVDEARASEKVKGKRYEHLAYVYESFGLPSSSLPKEGVFDSSVSGKKSNDQKGTLYCIIKEKLEPIPESEQREINGLVDMMRDDEIIDITAKGDFNATIEAIKNLQLKDIRNEMGLSGEIPTDMSTLSPKAQQRETKARNLAASKMTKIEAGLRKYQIPDMMNDLNSAGVQFADYKGDNIMKRGSSYVLVELGGGKSNGNVPPLLEMAIGRIVDAVIESLGGQTQGGTMAGAVGAAHAGAKVGTSGWSSASNIVDDDEEGGTWQDKLKGLQSVSSISGRKPALPKEK